MISASRIWPLPFARHITWYHDPKVLLLLCQVSSSTAEFTGDRTVVVWWNLPVDSHIARRSSCPVPRQHGRRGAGLEAVLQAH